jgi:hypothetical protein
MKTIPTLLQTHIGLPLTSICTCWKITLKSGAVKAFTDHDQDVLVEGITYLANASYSATNVQTNNGLNVDNMEVVGILSSPSITENDLRAGLWDYAAYSIFQVNWQSPTDGKRRLRDGHLGEVSLQENGQFRAELRGMMQAYTKNVGELTSPSCRVTLFDSRCTVNPASFTVTSALTGVNPDGITLYDTARTEPGPTGGLPISGVTNANPAHVTYTGALVFSENEAVILSGIVGPVLLNTVVVVHNPIAGAFDLSIDTTDTTDYPPYVSGGTVTPFGTSGYFEHGVITFTSGLNAGISREVKSYAPGTIVLQLPFPYQSAIGDGYTMTAGCDKANTTCKVKFSNLLNFRGEPHLPGIDKLIQVARHG